MTKTEIACSSVKEGKKRKVKRKKCSSCSGDGCKHCQNMGWVLAPFYGPGDGTSGAAISTAPKGASQGSKSGAYPGAGGANSPSVPAGANSGMGPVAASKEISGRAINEDMALIFKISEEGAL